MHSAKPAKYFCTVILQFLLFTTASAQIRIIGKTVDSSGNPLINVNALLLKQNDSSLVKACVSNKTGAFVLEDVATGNYIFSFSLVGYQSVYKTIKAGSQLTEMLLEPIVLQKEIKQLSELLITAQKPLLELKIDRTIVNVKNSVTLAGSNALDVLERSPGIRVDRQTNAISMMGKSGIIIMINGKISNMPAESIVQMLSGMNASSIERIELITTPPANFDAEGNAGIINLVLVKNKLYGTNGTVSATTGYVRDGPITNASVDFNNRSKTGNFYGNLAFSRSEWLQPFYTFRRTGSGAQINTADITSNREPVQLNFNGRLCYDFNLGKKTVLGAVVSGYSNKWSMIANNNVLYSTNNNLDSSIKMLLTEVNHWKNTSANLNLQHNFKTDTKLNIDFSYQYFIDKQPVDYMNNLFNVSGNLVNSTNTISRKTTPIHIYVLKADYETRLNKKLTVEAGFKTAINRFENSITVQDKINNNWKTDTSLSAHGKLKEDVHAIYTSFSFEVNEKTGIKAGLRYENTNTQLTRIDGLPLVNRKFGNLFPSVFLSRKINDKYSFNLSFSRRITRPTFNEMAPFVILLDPTTFITGNPGLKPSISYSFSHSWTLKQKIIQLTYSLQQNSIARFQTKFDAVSGRQIFYSENLNSIKTFALAFSMPVNPVKWWSMQYSLTGQWQQINSFFNGKPFQAQQTNYIISTTQLFKLPENFSLELRYNYNSRGLFGSYVTIPVSFLDAGIQKKFKNKISLSVNVADVFNSNRIGWRNNLSPEFYTKFTGQFFPRSFRLNFSVPFGSNEIKAARKRKMGAEEEKRVD